MKKIMILLFSILFIFIGINLYEFEKKVDYNQVLEIDTQKPLKNFLKKIKGSDKLFFKLYLKMKNGGRDIKAGYYELNGKYNTREIISILESGKSKMYKFTIIEGSTITDVFDKLASEKKLDRDKLENALREIKFPYPTPNGNFEGYFYPETYFIPEKSDEEYVIKIFLNYFLKMFPEEKYKNKEDFYQKLIVASMLQREALLDEEKPLMASVIYNRLNKNMPLGIDSTINFIFDYKKKRILYKDLEAISPYNTYKNLGLPPAPICNPTKSSVEAAYNPANTDYLYFVVKGEGKHHFSKTYKEHLRVQKK